MSASGGSSGGGGGSSISVSAVADLVVNRLLGRLITGILVIGGVIGSGFIEVGDALETGLLDPFEYIGGALGSVGGSLLSVVESIDALLLEISTGAGLAAPLVLLGTYALVGAIVGGVVILILRVSRRVIPIL
jgi:hypothetical protein